MLFSIALISLLLWLIIAGLPWRPWSVCERFDPPQTDLDLVDLHSITVLIPARNEAAHIAATLECVMRQGQVQQIIVVDDESTDNTRAVLNDISCSNLRVIDGKAPPPDWSGKLWALQQGLSAVTSECILLLDADIQLAPATLPHLLAKMHTEKLDFLSLMAHLKMETMWEKLLVPAFIFFFKLLYPFKLANDPQRRSIAAAAGGCILVRRDAVEAIGGFTGIRHALIDDCSFAACVKRSGFRTWIGLTHRVVSHRPYATLGSFWNMVARTAYCQLRYSPWLLLLCSLLMVLSFLVPLAALITPHLPTWLLGAAILGLMATCYRPVLAYYGRSPGWVLALPLVGVLFLGMTWTSAWRFALGEKSAWKGRVYRTDFSRPSS